MVEISMSGSGEGPVWVTGRGYSTRNNPYKSQGTSEKVGSFSKISTEVFIRLDMGTCLISRWSGC